MEATTYQQLRGRLDEWLAGERPRRSDPTEAGDAVAQQILDLVHEARFVVEALNATIGGASVIDKNKYDFVLSMLGRIITFDEFVLAEYPYELAKGRRPGVRVLLDNSPDRPRIVLVFFEDTRIWRVDRQERRVSYELISFELGEGGPTPRFADESAEYFAEVTSWRVHLREGLCLPILLLHDNA